MRFKKQIFNYHVVYHFGTADNRAGFGSMNIRASFKLNTEVRVVQTREFIQKELRKDPQLSTANVVLINWIRLKNVDSF